MSVPFAFHRSFQLNVQEIATRRFGSALLLCLLIGLMRPFAGATIAEAATQPDSRVREHIWNGPPSAPVDYREVTWEALVPANWNPMRDLDKLDFSKLSDGDPRAMRALEKLRQALDNAPIVEALRGTRARIAGFVVPLDVQRRQITEFLLVPYFGACIHTPPPPANQIIHVRPSKPLKNDQAMSAVWISGVLETGHAETALGNAGYQMKADVVTPYRKP